MNNIPDSLNKEINPSQYAGCPKCNGTGFRDTFVNGHKFKEKCLCYEEFQLNKLKEKSNIPELYINASFNLDENVSFYRFMPLRYDNVKRVINGETRTRKELKFRKPDKYCINEFGQQYVNVITKYLNQKPRTQSVGLILSGMVGSGKTFFACAIGNACIVNGLNVSYIKTKQYLDNVIKDSFDTSDEKKVKKLKEMRDYLNGFNKKHEDNCHVLILDELGYEYQKGDNNFALAEIKDLLRNRAEKSLPTIITTNFILDELVQTYEEEMVSMFAESYMFFCVNCSDDYRIKKSFQLDKDFDLSVLKTI
ncbi:ATP-binding protein [Clostridium perfringens]